MEIVCPCCGSSSDTHEYMNMCFTEDNRIKVAFGCPDCDATFIVAYEPVYAVECTEDLRIRE